MISVVAENGLYTAEPGVAFNYSDTGCSILARIIERVSGRSYQEFIETSFFLPHGLHESAMPDSAQRRMTSTARS